LNEWYGTFSTAGAEEHTTSKDADMLACHIS